MGEMVERLAKAIWLAVPRHHTQRDFGSISHEGSLELFIARAQARAAIAAMREPTKEMLEAGGHEAFMENADGVWRDMIDAALLESK